LGHCVTSTGNSLPTFRIAVSIFNLIQGTSWTTLKMDVDTYSETSVTNYQSTRRHFTRRP